jgi:hypothetical protein
MAFTSPWRQSNFMGSWANSGGDSEADAGIAGTGSGNLGLTVANGMWYYDTTNNVFRLRQGGAWTSIGTTTPGWDDVLQIDAKTGGYSPTISDGDTLTVGEGASGILKVAANGSLVVESGATATVADAPSNATDIVNKAYADSIAAGFDPKASSRLASVAALTNHVATGSGVGKALEAPTDASSYNTVDNVTMVVGDRFLLKDGGPDGVDPNIDNGIYEVTVLGDDAGAKFKMVRATDFDGSPAGEVSAGAFTFVTEGTAWGDSGWFVSTADPIVVDTDDIVFSQFAGVGTYSGTQGIDITANQISVDTLAAGGLDFGGAQSDELFVEVANFAGNGLESDGSSPPNLQVSIDDATDLTGIAIAAGDEVLLNDASGPDTVGRVLMSQILTYINTGVQLPNSLTDGAGIADFTFNGGGAATVALDLYNVKVTAAGGGDVNNNPLYLDATNGLNVKVDDSTISLDAGNDYRLYVPNAGISETQLANTVPGNGLTGGAGSSLSVVPADTATKGGLAVDADGVWSCAFNAGNPNTDTVTGKAGQFCYDSDGQTVWFCTADGDTNWVMV